MRPILSILVGTVIVATFLGILVLVGYGVGHFIIRDTGTAADQCLIGIMSTLATVVLSRVVYMVGDCVLDEF